MNADAASASAAAVKRRPRGPNDPDRRGRIARAAIAVVAEHGIDSLTHRKVAAAAGVALGSTTYYFATLEDLIAAALDTAAEADVAQLRAWAETLSDGVDLACALADYVFDSVSTRRAQTLAGYNLYVLALYRPHLRQTAVNWDNALSEVFIELTDPATGCVLGALLCGVLMQAVLREEPPTKADIEKIFRRVIAPARAPYQGGLQS